LKIEKKIVTDARIALGSVAPVPLRCTVTEECLRGRQITKEVVHAAQQALVKEISPIDDIRSNREYRRAVAKNLLADFLEPLC
jgi:carbon-monoxide dehydrogenase medium subunit